MSLKLFSIFGELGLKGTDKVNQELQQTTENAQQSGSSMESSFKKIGGAVATFFAVDKIIGFGKSIVDASASVSAEVSAFEQIMGSYSDKAKAKMHEVADETGVVDSRLTGHMTSMTAKFKGLGFDIDKATTLAADGLTLASDASAFWDKSLEDSMGALNSFINGSYEGGEAIGLFANDTQMASYAVKNGIVSETKEWANLDEARKQATRLEYAQEMMKASGATGQAAKEAGQYANVQANLTEKWRQFKAEIGEPLLQNIVIPAMNTLMGVVDGMSAGWQSLNQWMSENQGIVQALGIAFASGGAALIAYKTYMMGLSIINTVKAWMNGMTIAQKALNLAMSMNPIGLVIAGITALVTAFILLWNNCEGFRNFWIGLWQAIQPVAQVAIDFLVNLFNVFWQTVQTVWNAISITISTVMNVIWTVISTVWNTIVTVISTVLNTIMTVVSTVWNTISSIVSGVVNGILSVVSAVWNAISSVISTVMNVISSIISGVWNVISSVVSGVVNTIKSVVSGAWNAISSITSSVFNTVKGIVSSVWNGIKSTISGVVNGVKSVVSSVWNAIKSVTSSVFNGIKSTATSIWNGIKSAIEGPINTAKNIVKGAIDAIKGFFNFEFKWPHIPLPHFSISGSINPLDWLKGGLPKIGVEWYAKGGILEKPTAFGISPNGNVRIGGEAGKEAVAPISELMDYVRVAVAEQTGGMNDTLMKILRLLSQLLPNMNLQVVLDTGVLVGEIAEPMDNELGKIKERKNR